MLRERIVVDAVWDDEANVYVATSQDVPGLVTEAASLELLQAKLKILIPELLELNGGQAEPDAEAELVVVSEQHSRLRLHA